jgi:peptide/nickel transport system substrate-binding protein
MPPRLLFLLFSFALLSSCSRDPLPEPALTGDGPPVNGDTFVEASLGDPTRLNPLLATDSASNTVNGHVFNGLVKYDRDLKFVGDLAASWTVRRGGLEIVFKLRPNVRWHDGAPFTAADVVFTHERLADPKVLHPLRCGFRPGPVCGGAWTR